MIDSVAVVSGGMDSITVLYQVVIAGRQPLVFNVNYGQLAQRERDCAAHAADQLGLEFETIEVPGLYEGSRVTSVVQDTIVPFREHLHGDPQGPHVIPNRNMVLFGMAAAVAENRGCHDVFCGITGSDMSAWDCNGEFLRRLNHAMALNRRRPVVIHAPLAHLDKPGIVRLAHKLDVPLGNTWSCMAAGPLPCGICQQCQDREHAFARVGIPDPLVKKGD